MNISRVFWSVLDAPGVKGGHIPTGLWPLLEDDLPIPADQIFAIGTPIDGDRLLVCAALKADLMSVSTTDGVLTPDRVPDFISTSVNLSLLNFLIGPFEPAASRAARKSRRLTTAAVMLVAAILIGIGLERRAAAWKEETLNFNAASRSTLASLSSSPNWTWDDLSMELVQRRQTLPVDLNPPGDAAVALTNLLVCWPTTIPAKPQSLSATGETVWTSVLVPHDAAAFLAALNAPEGWKLEEPRMIALDNSTRVNLEFRKVAQ